MSVSPEKLQRIEAIFNQALALPEGDRTKLIALGWRCGTGRRSHIAAAGMR
jgi:hypothetical protein